MFFFVFCFFFKVPAVSRLNLREATGLNSPTVSAHWPRFLLFSVVRNISKSDIFASFWLLVAEAVLSSILFGEHDGSL